MRSVLLLPERREGKTKVMKQQYLPFTVLKLYSLLTSFSIARLQQCLPFTVLKRLLLVQLHLWFYGCNSSYRLRYAPKGARRQRSKATMKSALLLPKRRQNKGDEEIVLTVHGIETRSYLA